MRNPILTKSTLHGLLLMATSVCLTTVGLEVLLRLYHGKLFHLESIKPGRTGESSVDYHPRLGWIPKSGRFGTSWSWTTDETGLRSNGRPAPTMNRPILTVGDSFTFGDEVEDAETWPAHLEGLLQERVLNAGVFAYGLDQAYLRAEDLIDVYEPHVVIVAFISDDINRTEFSYYQGWKPYFEYVNDRLELRNVPVPRGHAPSKRLPTLNRGLGYSFLANAILTRTALAQWYSGPRILQRHHDGERVAVDLLTRLDTLAKRRNGRLVAISLATNGRIGGNERIPRVVARLRERGVPVLDLASEILQMQSDRLVRMFKRRGHYSTEMNAWVADRVAAFLQGTSAATDQQGGPRRASRWSSPNSLSAGDARASPLKATVKVRMSGRE